MRRRTIAGQNFLRIISPKHDFMEALYFLPDDVPLFLAIFGNRLNRLLTDILKHRPAKRAEPTKCWFVSKRKQARRT